MMRLAHLTIGTGDIRMVARADRGDAGVAGARVLLDRALAGQPAQLPAPIAGYGLAAERFGPHLLASVIDPTADHVSLEPIAIFGIAARSRGAAALWARLIEEATAVAPAARHRHIPPAPWCAVTLTAGALGHADAMSWLAELEQDIAWAWLVKCGG